MTKQTKLFFLFCILLFPSSLKAEVVNKIKAVVGSEIITQTDLKNAIKAQKATLKKEAQRKLSDEEIEQFERQLLGFSLSGKPVSGIIGSLDLRVTHKINEISPENDHGESVKVAGVVRDARVIVTKNGSEMAFVKIEDPTGTIELVIFPKIYKASKHIWIDNKPVLVSAKVDSRNDTPTLIVEAIETKDSNDNKDNEVFIKISKSTSPDQLKKLRFVLTQYPGSQAVILKFDNKDLTLPFKVAWSETLAKKIAATLEESGHYV